MFGTNPLGRLGFAIVLGLVTTLLLGFLLRRQAMALRLQAIKSELSATLWALALVPWLWLAGFAALVVRARLVLGFWPYPQHQVAGGGPLDVVFSPLDPKELGLHYDVLVHSVIALVPLLPVMAMVAIFSRAVLPRREVDLAIVIAIAGAISFGVLVVFDPGGYFDWFMD